MINILSYLYFLETREGNQTFPCLNLYTGPYPVVHDLAVTLREHVSNERPFEIMHGNTCNFLYLVQPIVK